MEKPVEEHREVGTFDAEAIPAPEGYQYIDIDPVVERSLVRKLDRSLMPLLFVSYLLAFLDRSNIGNAQTAGMGEALGFNDGQYQWLLTIFYIPYILFEWTAVMWKIVPPHRWAGIAVLIWGIAATLQATAFSWSGLMACRWFLATAEAGWGPGVPYLLSFFYRRHELGARCGIFLSAAPLATTFAGALAYGITSGHSKLANWRLLFLVEGLPTLVMAVAIFFFLPDSPDTARFLTPEEREVAAARGVLQTGQEGHKRIGGINLGEVLSTFKEPQTLILPLMYFSCNVSFASLPVFLPTILTTMGYSKINAQGLTAPPYFLSFLVCIGSTFLADRLRQRGLVIVVLSIMGGIGYLLLATVHTVGVRYLGVFLAAAGVFPAISNILPWATNNQSTDTKRGVSVAMLNIIGQCGPILGTRMFPTGDSPYYVKGMSVCAAFMFFNALLSLSLRQYLAYKNKQFALAEAEQAAAAEAAGEDTKPDKADWGPAGPEMMGIAGYRYIL
ncbi:major facilitator superfamily transporter [Grosmannia clavigera kw1407]|uniref:Major facilitator superfamily transporter n=1 Tax=Grosmannia clavigera (strain kw1407 / UAMH 11150) TaxID=655863 RepID=F0XMM4_GROCL|nr:major facilitator superfamily transporter [Grosmannia clavigera kw1407]EFX01484.1 major facilitator superfamily transporter [Grosmannia clavigera kw1407]